MESIESLQQEIARLKQAQGRQSLELNETKALLQSIIKNSGEIIFSLDLAGLIISLNPAAELFLGYKINNVRGRPFRDLADDPREFESLTTLMHQEGKSSHPAFALRHQDGRQVMCRLLLLRLTNPAGRHILTVIIAADLSLPREQQERLIQVDRLAEIGRMSSSIAHEINNPLAVISEIAGWTESVAADAVGLNNTDRQELLTALTKIGEQTKRCRAVTHQLLNFARETPPIRSMCDLHHLFDEVLEFLEPQLKYKPIEIKMDLAEEALRLQSEPKMLEQVLVNLMTNAIDAVQEKGAPGGCINISAKRAAEMVEIQVQDNGTGIREEDRGRIFDLFCTTKPAGKGTGLGLPISRNIVEKLGGRLSVDSRWGEGTTFTIRLPLT